MDGFRITFFNTNNFGDGVLRDNVLFVCAVWGDGSITCWRCRLLGHMSSCCRLLLLIFMELLLTARSTVENSHIITG